MAEEEKKNCTDCKHFGMCWLRRHKDNDEPCEQCSNCIKCESGSYQLGETEKDDQLTKATKLLKFWVGNFYDSFNHANKYEERHKALVETEQFLKEIEK